MKLPEEMNDKQFQPLLDHVQRMQQEAGSSAASLIVIQNGKIVTEWYAGSHHFKSGARSVSADSLFNIYSTRKTYIGLATAIAVIEGNLDLDKPLHNYMDDLPQEELAGITLRDLATKTGAKYFGDPKIEREELVCKLIKQITGQNIAQLITGKVLNPLGLSHTEWATAPKESLVCDFQAGDGYASVRIESDEGHERNLYTSTRDLAYWGYLHVQQGRINGSQLLPVEVFKLYESLRADEIPEKRILGWYYQQDWYYATGAAGCHCVIIPEHQAVGVRMYNKYTDNYKEDQHDFNSTLHSILQFQ
ncbi:serine hydrolase domain-containing protein [Paenibacillus nasutitermitis]|uniref:Beta-lactamase-related domain-containing protein n=1 Tax=Paenibacillus nasutitermitis TaxID=1652958 RepID=A0A916Z8M5_9BACL|nr:serine hydrolase domain-containing protein [Paenibacillus nasutitermitis]GGD81599.1 hypothetical protein GCM10010911_44650 [Paenibacillus nasutitermitis]